MNRKIRLYQGNGSSSTIDLENLICFVKYDQNILDGKKGYFIETRTYNGCGGQQVQFHNEERRETAYKKLLDSFKEYVPEDKDIITLEKGDGKIFRLKVKDCTVFNINKRIWLSVFIDNRRIVFEFTTVEQKLEQLDKLINKIAHSTEKDNVRYYETDEWYTNIYSILVNKEEHLEIKTDNFCYYLQCKKHLNYLRGWIEPNDTHKEDEYKLTINFSNYPSKTLIFKQENLRNKAEELLNDYIPLTYTPKKEDESLDKCVAPDNDAAQTKKTFTDTEKVKKIIAALTELDVKYDYTQNKDNSIEITVFIPRIDIDMKGSY